MTFRSDEGRSLVELLTETHSVYIPGDHDDGDSWSRHIVHARLCVGRGWGFRRLGYGVGGWLTVAGPSATLPRSWEEAASAALVVVVEGGAIMAVAVDECRLVERRRRLFRRRAHLDLYASGNDYVAGRIAPGDWGAPATAVVVPGDPTRYTIRFGGGLLVYVIHHVQWKGRWYTGVWPAERAAELQDVYWVSRRWLGKYLKLRNV